MSEHEPRIVEAVLTSANNGNLGGAKSALSKAIERAMAAAVTKAYADGVTDPEEQRERILAARADAKQAFAQAETEALAAATAEREGYLKG